VVPTGRLLGGALALGASLAAMNGGLHGTPFLESKGLTNTAPASAEPAPGPGEVSESSPGNCYLVIEQGVSPGPEDNTHAGECFSSKAELYSAEGLPAPARTPVERAQQVAAARVPGSPGTPSYVERSADSFSAASESTAEASFLIEAAYQYFGFEGDELHLFQNESQGCVNSGISLSGHSFEDKTSSAIVYQGCGAQHWQHSNCQGMMYFVQDPPTDAAFPEYMDNRTSCFKHQK